MLRIWRPLTCLASLLALAACGGTTAVTGPSDGGADAAPTVTPPVPTTTADAAPPHPVPITGKVDLLFMIDNSASMADKQELLRRAVPDLLTRLIDPRCLDASGNVVGASQNGVCAAGQLEFQPVRDMHIAIVSSSLGSAGADLCAADTKNPVNPALNAHADDQGHLLNRGGADEHRIADAQPSNFLAWAPAGQGAITDPTKLLADFQDEVAGVHQFGCGFEAQLESWYRFLVQPDPYASIAVTNGRASLQGVDATILQQRHDFLRPDSLVGVILLTDENDSHVDPMTLGGQGWAFENTTFPGSATGTAPHATASCATDPLASTCNSCAFAPNDPSCNPAFYDPKDDDLNVRFFQMKRRFGVDPQFPVQRYVRGLSQPNVPNRDGEHFNGDSNYTGEAHAGCTNPLFAASLPTDPNADLCHLASGPRSPTQVFYLLIGGVPHQLLQLDPNDPNSPQKASLSVADWQKVLGKDPLNYDFSGVDPHMLESLTPRNGIPGPSSSDTADPMNGREWDTQGKDLEYACVFDLPLPKDCTSPAEAPACDCEAALGTPPLCSPTTPTTQIRGKAYPTIRELAVARALGPQGVVSSICPIHTQDSPGASDPLYGYRPAMSALVDHMKALLPR